MLLTIISFSFSAFAEGEVTSVERTQFEESNTYYEYDLATKTLTISGNGDTPSFSGNGQGQPWYEWRSAQYISKVVFEEGITSIGNYFLYQVQADSILLPSTLIKIGNYSFYSNNKIAELEIPFGVTSMGTQAFRYCAALKSIDLPDTLLTIGNNSFEGCKAIEEITIPYSVTSIGTKAFLNCSKLLSVNFQSLTSSVRIGDNCFTGCALLKEISIPINASVEKYAFGFKNTSGTKYTDTKMKVFKDSKGHAYAITSAVSYELFDTIDVDCAIGYSNEYTSENVSENYTYRFVPNSTEKYNIYTRGDCDVEAILTKDSKTISTTEDISDNDRNFCISEILTAGEEYIITVSSLKSNGNYTLWIYPDNINSIGIKSTPITVNAERDMKIIDDSLLNKFVIDISFSNGLSDKLYYQNDFFNGTYLKQKGMNLTCGNTHGAIEIGDVYAEYPLSIEHSYEKKEIPYTVDDDGYYLYSCVLCDDSYKDGYIKTPSIKLTGRIVFPARNNKSPSDKPYNYISKIVVKDIATTGQRTYYIDENGYFEIRSFKNFDATFYNDYGDNVTISLNVTNLEPYTVVDKGSIVVNAYDFNNDQYVNAKDYAIYLKEKRSSLPKDYMDLFSKNLI